MTAPLAEAAAESTATRTALSRRRLSIDGTTLAYVERGDGAGEPIVLLHGYLGSHLSWRHQLAPFDVGYRVLALDWFGWGDAGRSVTLQYDYDSEVDRLRRVLDALGVTRGPHSGRCTDRARENRSLHHGIAPDRRAAGLARLAAPLCVGAALWAARSRPKDG